MIQRIQQSTISRPDAQHELNSIWRRRGAHVEHDRRAESRDVRAALREAVREEPPGAAPAREYVHDLRAAGPQSVQGLGCFLGLRV